MPMDATQIEQLIRDGIADAHVQIEDLRGDGEHYAAIITAEAFKGLTRIAQHRLVQQAFQGKLGTDLHALQIHTRVPQEK